MTSFLNLNDGSWLSKVLAKDTTGCLVNSLTIASKIDTLYEKMINNDNDHVNKLKIGLVFYNLLYDIYKIPAKKNETILPFIMESIRNFQAINMLRISFISYKNYTVSNTILKQVVETDIFETFSDDLKVLLMKKYFYLDYNRQICIDTLLFIFGKEDVELRVKMNIADFFILIGHQLGYEMLDEVRELQDQRFREIQIDNGIFFPNQLPPKVQTVYNDNQNVHNSEINKKVLEASVYLILNYNLNEYRSENFEEELKERINDEETKEIIANVFKRIEVDSSIFTLRLDKFSLKNVLNAVCGFGKRLGSDDFWDNLIFEMKEMNTFCATGHLSRLINSIQPFTENPLLQITISNNDKFKAIFAYRIEKLLSGPDVPSHITDAIIELDFKPVCKYIVDNQKILFDEILDEVVDLEQGKKIIENTCSKITGEGNWVFDSTTKTLYC